MSERQPVPPAADAPDRFEEVRLLARLRLLNEVAHAAAGNLDLSRILRVALRELDRQLPLQVCAAWLVDEEDRGAGASESSAGPRELVLADCTAGPGTPPDARGLTPGLRVGVDQTPFAPCLHEGQAFYADLDRAEEAEVARPQAGDAWIDRLGLPQATCSVAVPLRAGERTVGVLQSVCLRPSGFTGEQIQLLHLVADLVGPAVSNCQLFGRLSSAYEALRVTQAQLIQNEKMRALGEMASGMAHEFNNSLCGALGFLELALLNRDLPPSVRAHLEHARVCALDAAQTVSRVQDFGRLRHHDAAQPLDLNELVRQSVALIRHKWEGLANTREAPVSLEVRTEAAARVAGSATELREVLTNLAFNAVDAMPQGGTLTLRTWSSAAGVFLSVADTGVGIPEAIRHRLFEPFFTTKGERGNGLGLSVTFGIVRRHGGEIRVESRVGAGTTFTVRLPALPEGGGAAPEASPAAAAAPGPAARGLRVLVVEDEESIRRFLEASLSGLGHRPRVTADGREALAAFAAEPFDVVLTDLGLPEVSGEEVARAVRRRSPSTPVVLLTGWADQLQAESQSLEGISRVLNKPVTLATLAATLAAVCSR